MATDSPIDRSARASGELGGATAAVRELASLRFDRKARAGGGVGPGDHGACARAGSPVTRQWILQSTDQARASGERPGDHGACGRARVPGAARGTRGRCRWVLGDHGACAQGRMPVTWQRILQLTEGRALVEGRQVIIARALGARYPLRSNGCPGSAAARALAEGGQVIMGCAADRARRGRACAGVGGKRQADHRACTRGQNPLRSNGFPNRRRRVRWRRAAR